MSITHDLVGQGGGARAGTVTGSCKAGTLGCRCESGGGKPGNGWKADVWRDDKHTLSFARCMKTGSKVDVLSE